MVIGTLYEFSWSDILDCTVMLSRDGGQSYSPIAENVQAVVTEESVTGSYVWAVTGPASETCRVKFIDNSDLSELIGQSFAITEPVLGSGSVFRFGYGYGWRA